MYNLWHTILQINMCGRTIQNDAGELIKITICSSLSPNPCPETPDDIIMTSSEVLSSLDKAQKNQRRHYWSWDVLPVACKLIVIRKNQCKAPSSRRSYCCHTSYKWQHYCVSFIFITYFAIHYAYYQLGVSITGFVLSVAIVLFKYLIVGTQAYLLTVLCPL